MSLDKRKGNNTCPILHHGVKEKRRFAVGKSGSRLWLFFYWPFWSGIGRVSASEKFIAGECDRRVIDGAVEESFVPNSLAEETSSAVEESVGGGESSALAESVPEESSPEESSQSESSLPEESSGAEESSPEKEVDEILGMEYVTVDPDATDWNLLLVNKTHRLAENLEWRPSRFSAKKWMLESMTV